MHSSSQSSVKSVIACDRDQLRQWMAQCRQTTLALFTDIDHPTLCHQAHPDFSPIGWHLGHIAYTEGLWILEHLAGMSPPLSEYRRLFAADILPKGDRVNLPPLAEIQTYLDTIRTQVFAYLTMAPLDQQERLWLWLLQHESQHCETIAIVLALQGQGSGPQPASNRQAALGKTKAERSQASGGGRQELNGVAAAPVCRPCSLPISPPPSPMLFVPAGAFEMGNETAIALDNERPSQRVQLEDYWIAQAPVTCAEYQQFMQAGGYRNAAWWSALGWAWVQSTGITQPLYWSNQPDRNEQAVCGVNWYEAEAYANSVGCRLPTEAEWEKATQVCSGMKHVGRVWEWTNSWFAGYPNFAPYPYRGYSQAYFDGKHRVLRGGSWATQPWSLRPTFRNWYYPHVREIFAGFRCAKS